jgi:chromosome segregation ATPase
MVELSPTTAITDLLWLQNRFKGILELLPKLEEVNTLENYSAELKASVKTLEADNAALSAEKKNLQAALSKAKADADLALSKAKLDADAVVAAANAAASAAREEAREALANEIQELGNQKAKKVAELAELDELLIEAKAKVDQETSQYEALSNLIAEMKAKF